MTLYEAVTQIQGNSSGAFELGWVSTVPFLLSDKVVLIGDSYFGRGLPAIRQKGVQLQRQRGHRAENLVGFYQANMYERGVRVGAVKGVRANVLSRLNHTVVERDLFLDQRHRPVVSGQSGHGYRLHIKSIKGRCHYVNAALVDYMASANRGGREVSASLVRDRNKNIEILLESGRDRAIVPVIEEYDFRYSTSGVPGKLFEGR